METEERSEDKEMEQTLLVHEKYISRNTSSHISDAYNVYLNIMI